MRDVLTADEVAGTLAWEPLVSSWLGGEWLADVPVMAGSVTWSTRREVPGSLDLTVPRIADWRDWLPVSAADPLAHYGQTLHASIRVTLPVSRRIVVVRVGTFRVTSWQDEGGTVRVVGQSMMQVVENARLKSPTSPRTSGTLASELRRLVPATLGVVVDSGLTDRTCPRMTWGESRMDAIREIATAWPARLRETVYGDVTVLPPLDATPDPVLFLHDGETVTTVTVPVVSLDGGTSAEPSGSTDGGDAAEDVAWVDVDGGTSAPLTATALTTRFDGGTVVSAYTSGSEDGLFNVVVARGTETDDAGAPLVQHVASQESGPLRVSGPFGEKPRFFASPLLTSTAAAASAARTMLADAIRQERTIPVVCATDPRIELDDAVEVRTHDGQRHWGYVSGYTLPLTYSEDMRLDVEVA